MSLAVTPGAGATIATRVSGSDHVQRIDAGLVDASGNALLGQKTAAASMPVVAAAVPPRSPSITFTLPNPGVSHADGTVLTYASAGVLSWSAVVTTAGDACTITGARIVLSGYTPTPPDLDLVLFSTVFGADQDAAAFTPTYAELLFWLCTVKFRTWVPGDKTTSIVGNQHAMAEPGILPYRAITADTIIYGNLVNRTAGYTPFANAPVSVWLDVDPDKV